MIPTVKVKREGGAYDGWYTVLTNHGSMKYSTMRRRRHYRKLKLFFQKQIIVPNNLIYL
jgi:hypothetical protein